jgi:hypothetical protein
MQKTWVEATVIFKEYSKEEEIIMRKKRNLEEFGFEHCKHCSKALRILSKRI